MSEGLLIFKEMKTAEDLKEKARHEIDTPGHPSYGCDVFTFTENELEDYVNQRRSEGLDKLMYDFFKGSGFERLAEAQMKEQVKQQEFKRKKEIREQYEYLKWRIDRGYMLSESQRSEYEYCMYKVEIESKQN